MTGREHYLAAEALLQQSQPGGWTMQPTADDLLEAQVHATLALAAATSPTMVPA